MYGVSIDEKSSDLNNGAMRGQKRDDKTDV